MAGTQSFGETNIGRRRELNEDSVFFDDGLGLYIVADGMGGQNAGEVASKTAVDAVVTFMCRSKDDEITWPFGLVSDISYNGNRLRTALMLANKRVWREAEDRKEYIGMGTTIVVACVDNAELTICSAGDCRAYRIRHNQLEQLTIDDSWVQAARSAGAMDPDRLQDHPLRNIVTKAVGARETIDVDVVGAKLQDGDLYLLCSDGLHGMLQDSKILQVIMAAGGDLQKTVAELIAAANAAGGKDNVTALLLRYSA